MVIDTLDNLEKYVSLNPLFKDVVDFVKANDLGSLEPGKYEIKGADLFVNIQTAKGKTKEEQRAEGIRIAREAVASIRDKVAGVQVSAPFGNVQTAIAVIQKT